MFFEPIVRRVLHFVTHHQEIVGIVVLLFLPFAFCILYACRKHPALQNSRNLRKRRKATPY